MRHNKQMARALLLYNPRSGSGRGSILAPQLLNILSARYPGIEAEPTRAARSAGEQVRAAIERGVDTVFVCGGDGTLLDALQGAVGRDVTLAILPLGTGNVIARDLGLPLNPVAAAQRLLRYEVRVLPVGLASRAGTETAFLAAAGAGLHAQLMHLPKTGTGTSRAHYFRRGAQLALRENENAFHIRLTLPDGTVREEDVSEVIVARVRTFGGVLRLWKPGADLTKSYLRVIFTRSHHRMRLLWFLVKSVAGIRTHSDRHVVSIDVEKIECLSALPIHAQLDGEAYEYLPVTISTREGAIRMLMPQEYPLR